MELNIVNTKNFVFVFLCEVALYIKMVLLSKPSSRERKMNQIYLKSENKSILNGLIEMIIFNRFGWFINDPRGNNILKRSVIRVTSFSFLALLLGAFFHFFFTESKYSLKYVFENKKVVTIFISYLFAVNSVYWLERNKFASKWKYLNTLFNDIAKAPREKRSLLENALVSDIVVMQMWGHRSLRELCFEESIRAMKDFFYDFEIHVAITKLRNKDYTEKQLAALLSERGAALYDPYYKIQKQSIHDKNWEEKLDEQFEKYLKEKFK